MNDKNSGNPFSSVEEDVFKFSSPRTSLRKRISSRWAQKTRDKDETEDTRGPLGLRILYASPEPLINLIFVHGLRGGSTKTWTKGEDPKLFWPQRWLPKDLKFYHVSIHSFGYDSDWASTKSSTILDVHDFGRSLFEEMRNSPYLTEDSKGPIILFGHSMGGLVVKKAFILSRNVTELKDRIRAIFFLATPHRGSDYAAILNKVLNVSSMNARQYINDLMTGSTSTLLINDDFADCARELPIFSFFETLKTKMGFASGLIVEKNSAVLGDGFNERHQLINANHRDICKFDTPEEPNYVTIRNALSGAIQTILEDISASKIGRDREQLKFLRKCLGATDRIDEHHEKLEGTCQWIDAREDFRNWRDGNDGYPDTEKRELRSENPSIYWIHANPGTGKTVLASHVIARLQELGLACAYHYFHINKKASRSLEDFLRAMAYQMAVSNATIREMLLTLCHEGATSDKDDSRAIWIKLFRTHILEV
jgi:pimeloyl-ACP methyl ester carboxylesterase